MTADERREQLAQLEQENALLRLSLRIKRDAEDHERLIARLKTENLALSNGAIPMTQTDRLRALVEHLKAQLQSAEHFDPEESPEDTEFHRGRRYALHHVIGELDAVLRLDGAQDCCIVCGERRPCSTAKGQP
jgi:hypothetical protein